jgi:hypothetical protein
LRKVENYFAFTTTIRTPPSYFLASNFISTMRNNNNSSAINPSNPNRPDNRRLDGVERPYTNNPVASNSNFTPSYQVSGILPNESPSWQQQHISPAQERFVQNYNSYTPHNAFSQPENNRQNMENQKNFSQYNIAPNFQTVQPISRMLDMEYQQNTLYNNLHKNLLAESIQEYRITIDSADRNVLNYPDPFEYVVQFGPVVKNDLSFSEPTLMERLRAEERKNNKYIKKRQPVITDPTYIPPVDEQEQSATDLTKNIYIQEDYAHSKSGAEIEKTFKNVKYVKIENVVLPKHNSVMINCDWRSCPCSKKRQYIKDDYEHIKFNILRHHRYVPDDLARDSLYQDRYVQIDIKELQNEFNLGTNTVLSNAFTLYPDRTFNWAWYRSNPYYAMNVYKTSLLGNVNKATISFYNSQQQPITLNTKCIDYEINQIIKTKLLNPATVKLDDEALYTVLVTDFIEYIKCFVAINHDIATIIPFYGYKKDVVYEQFEAECKIKSHLVKLSEKEFEVDNIYDDLDEFVAPHSRTGFVAVEKKTRGGSRKLITIEEYLKSIIFYPTNKNLEPLFHNYSKYGLDMLRRLKVEIAEIPKSKWFQNTFTMVIGVYQNELNTMINYTSQT